MKALFTALCLGGCFLLLLAEPISAEPGPPVLTFAESKPVTVEKLEFTTVTETDWAWPQPLVNTPLLIQLRITNKSAADVVFRTFDSFHLVLIDPKGGKVQMQGGRDATTLTEDVVIRPGQAFTLSRQATFTLDRESLHTPDNKSRVPKLSYLDGTGSGALFTLREPGDYQLKFVLKPSPLTSAPEGKAAGKTVWTGNAETTAVVFRLHAARDLKSDAPLNLKLDPPRR